MDVSIIIVNYKTPELLLRCLQSIVAHTKGVLYEVIVVDNDSQDNSRQLLEANGLQVIWKDVNYNSGFARANNIGLRAAQGNYALLFNSDAFLKDDAITAMWKHYRGLEAKHKTGLLGCKIVSESGKLLRGTHIGFPGIKKVINANALVILLKRVVGINPGAAERYAEAEKLHYVNHEADIISGACVFTNLQTLKKENLFLDEDFFLYSEDVEWSYRYKQKGYRNFFTTEVEVVHQDSASTTVPERKLNQIMIAEWLLMLKMNGVFYFNLYMQLLRFNKWLDYLLEKRDITQSEKAITGYSRFKAIFNRYYAFIKQNYTGKREQPPPYLKYEE